MNTTTDADTGTSPEALRESMVDRIVEAGRAKTGRVEEVMRDVPRDQFVPHATVEEAYGERAVITKSANTGEALSCASEPRVVAMMLDQVDIQPGNKILEGGAGTGYNAALMKKLAEPSGTVVTIDIDTEVTAEARANLDANGYNDVHVATRDAVLGDPEHAPYDRIILTVGSWDIPPAWWNQLAPGGRLVVPLRWRGQTRSIAFNYVDGILRSDSVELCGFVPMVGQEGEKTIGIATDDQVTLTFDTDQPIDGATLRGVLDQPSTAAWSGVTVRSGESFDGIWLRLTGIEAGTCRIAATDAAVASGLCTPAIPVRSPALVDGDSLAYFTLRRQDQGDEKRWELGAAGHGPAGPDLADRLCAQISVWDGDRTTQPVITAYSADTPDDQITGARIIDKQYSRLVVSF